MLLSVFNYMFPGTEVSVRTYATNNPSIHEDVVNKFHPRLRTIFQQMDAIAPRFILAKGEISILTLPSDFYNTLKQKIASAKTRIFLSSLYVGKAQIELVQCLEEALTLNENLEVSILTDALRGTREAPNASCSASLLVTLVEKFGKRVDLRMYHTPQLSGISRSITPKRFNETYGLQHMKLYGFDDEVILSGANLSQDYFTDRQDRYYIFNNKKLTNYYYLIQSAISLIAYQVLPTTKLKQGFSLTWPLSNKSCEPHMNLDRFISDTSHMLDPLLKQHDLTSFEEFSDQDEFDTIVYPVSQFTPLYPAGKDNSTEKPAILRLLSYLDSPTIEWWFTAGYFNMLPQIQDRLVNGKAKGSVITASPKANSFYKSSGVSYYVPEAYLLFAKRFLEKVYKAGKSSLVTVYEWQNGIVNTTGGWSYHAKGLWITVPDEDCPSITCVGSSNYTKRAYSLDLETNAVIITKDPELKQQMRDEISNLMTYAKKLELSDFEPKKVVGGEGGEVVEGGLEIDEDRRISVAVLFAMKLIGGRF